VPILALGMAWSSCKVEDDENLGVWDFEVVKAFQNVHPVSFTQDEINKANTAVDVDYLTEEEKKVIFFCNLARLDGKRFTDDFAELYIYIHKQDNGLGGMSNPYVVSFFEDLEKVHDLAMLIPSKELSQAAKFHADDLSKHGTLGHTSSDGTTFDDRLRRYLSDAQSYAENCSCGYYNNKGYDVSMQFLIDNGVSSLGHRKNILNPSLTHIGVAISKEKNEHYYYCVQDFARIEE